MKKETEKKEEKKDKPDQVNTPENKAKEQEKPLPTPPKPIDQDSEASFITWL